MIDIYDVEGNVLMQAEITSSAKREEELSKSDYISLSWNSTEKVILPVGAYINHTYKIDKVREVTRQFLLLEAYEPTQTDEMSWKYTPEFQHPKMILSKVPFYVRTRNSQDEEIKQHVWSFVGTMHTIAEQLQDFLNKEVKFGNAGWTVHYDETNSNTINVSFSDNDFISALSAIVNAIGDNCEWHIDYDDEIIYIGKVLIGATPVVLEVGKNVGVPSINISKEGYFNAFFIFGGTRNITQVNSKGENVSSGDIRLQLDEGNGTITIDGKECPYSIDKYSTLDLRADKAKEPLFTKVLDFSQIFPSLNTYVYNVRGRVKYVLDKNNEKIPISYNTDDSVKEYKTFTIWYMRLAYPTTEKVEGKKIINTTIDDGVTHYWYDFEITDSLLVNGKNIGCSFEANFNKDALPSPLAGRGSNGSYVGFELTYHRDASSSHSSDDVSDKDFAVLAGDYEIVYQEDNDLIIPTNVAEMIVPKGETLPSLKCNITVLYNIAMADSIYIKDAQQRLLDAAIQEIQRLRSDLNNYTIKSYPQVFVEQNPCLQIGQKVTYDDGNGYTLSTRVLKLSTNIDYDFIQEITVGNQAIKGTITQLRDDVQSIIASGENGSGGSSYTEAQLRNLIARYGTSYFLSKQFNDTAQGLITFAKGLISDMLAKLNGGATFGTGGYKFDEKGNVVVDALSSLAFDEALERGFGVTKNSRGKYTLSVTDLMVWGKAVFNSLEIRKLYSVGGNVYLSGASSKIVRAMPVKKATVAASSTGVDASAAWVACAEGDADCEGWKCYTLNDDGTTATQNGWRKYDQAKCQTFDIEAGAHEGVSNTFYWRLVADVSTKNETITETRTETYVDKDGVTKTREVTVDLYDGKKFGWVVLSKTDCESTTNDAPKAGDTIVLDGHRMFASGDAEGRDQYNDESRTNVMMLETTGTENGTLPRIVALTGIVDYRHWDGVNQYSNTVFILSPKEVVFVSSSFKFMSASGDPITLVNFRGNWAEGTEYRYYDQVSHGNAIWTCIVEKGKATTEEPSDTSTDWRKEISGGKGEKGDKGDPGTPGKDAVTYGVQVTPTYEVWSDAKKHAGIVLTFTKTTGSTMLKYLNVQALGTAKLYVDGTELEGLNKWVNGGSNKIIFDSFTFDGTNNTPTIGTASVIIIELIVDNKIVATANYANGKQGADGKGALEIICDPETIVLDTDDNGLVKDYSNAWAGLMCVRDGKVVGNVTYNIGEHDTVNCDATVNNNGIVTITSVDPQTVAIDGSTVTVSSTSGSVTVNVTEDATGVTYTKTVPFAVNVARYTGGLKADNKKFESVYNYLTNDGNSTDFKLFESKIRQTAKEISLKVSEKSVGRRNMLVGSACRKYGDGFKYMSGSETRYYDGYPLEQIEINSGIDGVNCIHCRTKRTGTDSYHLSGFSWNGISPQGNIKLEKGKNYVLSFYAKTPAPNDIYFIAEVLYQGSKIDTSRPAGYDGPTGYSTTFSVSEANKWELFTVKVSVPSDAKYEYEEINIFARGVKRDYFVDGYICKPMLEEGEEYNGWTLSEQDYDYVGGNLLDGTGTLTKTGNVEVLDETTVKQGGYNNESASVKAILQPTWKEYDFLRYSTTDMGLNVGEDCMLSFYARAASGYAHGELQCFLYDPSTGIVMTESSHEKLDFLWNPGDGDLHTHITPPTAWKRYWVHWRPMGNVPLHVLFRLLRPGTDQGSYDSSTSYNVGDVVLYGGTYYVCQKAGSGYKPGASSYWEATEFAIEIARPKLEVGATMTEWTEKRSDMVDKQALYATGIDIENKKITLTANNTKFRDNDGNELAVIDQDGLRSSKIATTDTGHGHTVIEGNTTVWFQKDGKTPGIAVFYDAAGVPHLAFYGTDGKQKYDIGPSGLQSLISSIQQAHSDTAYLRDATSYVHVNNSTLTGFEWLYVASGEKKDMRYIYRKQIPMTDASAQSGIYDGCVFTKEYSGTNWPNGGNLLANGWYVKPNDGNLPMKLHMADEEGVLDPTKTLYYQAFYYYEGGKVARTVRAYMKRSTKSDLLLSKFEYAGSYDEIL